MPQLSVIASRPSVLSYAGQRNGEMREMARHTMWLAGVIMGSMVFGIAAAPEQIIADRRAGFKHMGENFKAMKEAIDSGGDVAPLAVRAAEIADWAKRIPTMFPPGSDSGGGTHAKPDIWTDRAGFDQHASELQQAAAKLEQAAASGNKDAFAAQWRATGQVCGGCHKTYRYRIS